MSLPPCLKLETVFSDEHKNFTQGAAWCSKFAATVSWKDPTGCGVAIRDPVDCKLIKSLGDLGNGGCTQPAAISTDESLFATGDGASGIIVFDTTTWERVCEISSASTFGGALNCNFRVNCNSELAVAHDSGFVVYDLENKRIKFRDDTDCVDVRYRPDGSSLVAIGGQSTIYFFDTNLGKRMDELSFQSSSTSNPYTVLWLDNDRVVFADGNHLVVIAVYQDRCEEIANVKVSENIDSISRLALSHHKHFLAVGAGFTLSQIFFFQTSNLEKQIAEPFRIAFETEKEETYLVPSAMAFSPKDDKLIITTETFRVAVFKVLLKSFQSRKRAFLIREFSQNSFSKCFSIYRVTALVAMFLPMFGS